jgi:hypothetical protein
VKIFARYCSNLTASAVLIDRGRTRSPSGPSSAAVASATSLMCHSFWDRGAGAGADRSSTASWTDPAMMVPYLRGSAGGRTNEFVLAAPAAIWECVIIRTGLS